MGPTSLLDGPVRVRPLRLRSNSSKSVLPMWCCLGRLIALVVLKKIWIALEFRSFFAGRTLF